MAMVYASYNNIESANLAIDTLIKSGYSKDNISVVTLEKNRGDISSNVNSSTSIGEDTTAGIKAGAATGGVIGLIAGIAALTVPGFGPLLIAGPLAATLGLSGAAATTVGSIAGTTAAGAVAGGAVGGAVGLAAGLIENGVSDEDANKIETSVRNGGVMVSVVDDSLGNGQELSEILKSSNPESLVTSI
jgi:hypothetical protein